MPRKKLLFIATVDYFLHTHFQPLLRRAYQDGFEVVVAARRTGVELEGARVVDVPMVRGSLSAIALLREALWLRAIIRKERPDIVHALSLKPILLSIMVASDRPRALALTGLGYLGIRRALREGLIRTALRTIMRHAVAMSNSILVVENLDDRRWVECGARLADEKIVLLPGAGVNPSVFKPSPEPKGPITVGVVSRLVWSKGVDLAVEAVRLVRSRGHDIQLLIAGDADPANPESVTEEERAIWAGESGVQLVGRIENVSQFWAQAHIACVPSRGGEGLPRVLLEAAACGRPLLTTQTPGCSDFVSDGVMGFVVPRNDARALAAAILRLAGDVHLRQSMGRAARARILDAYTEQHVADKAAEVWSSLLSAPAIGIAKEVKATGG